MNGQIIGLAPGLTPSLESWLRLAEQEAASADKRAVLNWTLAHYHHAVQDIFGYHALQIGAASLPTLTNSRIANRWLALDDGQDARASLFANACALPFFEATLDLVTLPFTLDAHSDPDAVLEEVVRVLVPEARTIITGFDPCSLWGLSHRMGSQRLPQGLHFYGLKRLKQALTELGMVVEFQQRRSRSVDGLYGLVARKRVMTVRPLRRKLWYVPARVNWARQPTPAPV